MAQDAVLSREDAFRIAGAAGLGLADANNLYTALTRTSSPVVDLEGEFGIVPNNSSLSVRQANTAGIKNAISQYSGTGACLTLPMGVTYVEEDTAQWCIKFGTGVSDLTLAGHGMFASYLVQFCAGDSGELDLIIADGCQRITFRDFGMYQHTITSPDPTQQNHLLCVYNNTLGGTTQDITGTNLYFGKCLGDGIRLLAADSGDRVRGILFSNCIMLMNGVVASTPANGRTGARSGIAVQRGAEDVLFSNFYIRGTQNSQIDEEPSAGSSRRVNYLNFICDNRYSSSGTAISLGGSGGGDIAYDGTLTNVHCLGGKLTLLGGTSNYKLNNITVETTAAMPADTGESLVLIRSGSAPHDNLVLNNITIKRTGTSAVGPCLDMVNTGAGTTITSLAVTQGTATDPVVLENSKNLIVGGVRVQYDGASPSTKSALTVKAIGASADDLVIKDIIVASSTGKLKAAVNIQQRTPHNQKRVQVRDIHADGYALNGVYLTLDSRGGTPDRTPELSGICNGSDPAWTQTDENDAPTTNVYPIIAGSRGAACIHTGVGTPEGAVTAVIGSQYARLNGGAGTSLYVKESGSGNTGWVAK